jgi:hypothetical protein
MQRAMQNGSSFSGFQIQEKCGSQTSAYFGKCTKRKFQNQYHQTAMFISDPQFINADAWSDVQSLVSSIQAGGRLATVC